MIPVTLTLKDFAFSDEEITALHNSLMAHRPIEVRLIVGDEHIYGTCVLTEVMHALTHHRGIEGEVTAQFTGGSNTV